MPRAIGLGNRRTVVGAARREVPAYSIQAGVAWTSAGSRFRLPHRLVGLTWGKAAAQLSRRKFSRHAVVGIMAARASISD
jgi:hypothetical protein